MKFLSHTALLMVTTCAPFCRASDQPLPCSETGAFGQKFGATEIVGSTFKGTGDERFIPAVVRMPPFDSQLVAVTQKSRQVFAVTATAAFRDPTAASTYVSALLKRFRTELPIADEEMPDQNNVVLYTDKRGVTETLGGKPVFFHTAGVSIAVEVQGSTVHVECRDFALHSKHVSEAMAK